jgi:hypothetical protein
LTAAPSTAAPSPAAPLPDDPVQLAVERWLVKRGAPHFVDGYRSRRRALARALPLLGLIVVVGLVTELSFLANGSFISALAGLVILGGALGLVYLAVSYGIVSMTAYVLKNLGEQVRLLGKLSSRAIPLLLLITVSLFVTGETWQMSSRLVGASQFATLGLFVLSGGFFLVTRVPGVVSAVEQFDSWSEVREIVADTPAAAIALPHSGDPAEPRHSRSQRINLVVMALTTQAVQITLVALAVYGFFLVLGVVAVHPETAALWIGSKPSVIVSFRWGASTFALTEELLRVAGFLAAFSGLAFSVYLVTDSTYREEFASDVSEDLRKVLAVRLAYEHHLGHAKPPANEPI